MVRLCSAVPPCQMTVPGDRALGAPPTPTSSSSSLGACGRLSVGVGEKNNSPGKWFKDGCQVHDGSAVEHRKGGGGGGAGPLHVSAVIQPGDESNVLSLGRAGEVSDNASGACPFGHLSIPCDHIWICTFSRPRVKLGTE